MSFDVIPTSVASSFADRLRALEDATLSPLAVRSWPASRPVPEPECSLRTPFQRDRDRIVHSKAFRRLKHKTQVFVAPEGDHFRTRLTHTLEATGVSRTVARALRLNEDLVEAIGLGHDLGHTPFGHTGEAVLDRCVRERFGRRFRHYEHSLRIVDVLEDLNLCDEVRDGIVGHSGGAEPPSTLEGRIVRLVDRIAYINHDIDDALRAGVLQETDLPREEIAVLGRTGAERIDTLVHDLVEHSEAAGDIVQSELIGGAMLRLRDFMFERVYLGAVARAEHAKIERMMTALFEHFCAHPELVTGEPPDWPGQEPLWPREQRRPAPGAASSQADRIIDYLAGMTDRFAIRAYTELTVPRAFGP